ncbi:glycosyltransferase family A protein [Chishuiella sp.]|uniref:glycosyltransferase family A protein n=1 Tax=Chishuiella sp. TaxID=1969467 RepID=UPI0028AFA118|nr:glycosyltransferase family A protein [Chishuiella sp.]
MYSVLVPVYNWDIEKLAICLSHQISKLTINIEVIFFDDFSSNQELLYKNELLIEQLGFKFYKSSVNNGIAHTLNLLAKSSKYEWLIYLDADIIPVQQNFIDFYIHLNKNRNKIYCGGLLYETNKPKKGVLRWKYGRKYEVQTTQYANQNPYLNFKACNFFVHKSILSKHLFTSNNDNYYAAVDTLFGLKLKNTNVSIEFVDNRVYHLGLDSNEEYLNKAKLYVKSIVKSYKDKQVDMKSIRLIEFYERQNSFKIKVYSLLFSFTKPIIYMNLLSRYPSIYLFQFFKLGYFIEEMET